MAEEVAGSLSIVLMVLVASAIGFILGASAAVLVNKSIQGLAVEPIAVSGNAVVSGWYVYIFIHSSAPSPIAAGLWLVCSSYSQDYGSYTIYPGSNYIVVSKPWWFDARPDCKIVLNTGQGAVSIPTA
jgi:hypothetical protein